MTTVNYKPRDILLRVHILAENGPQEPSSRKIDDGIEALLEMLKNIESTDKRYWFEIQEVKPVMKSKRNIYID